MTATKILWGQILVVFAIVLATMWAATQWTAWRLGFQPQLGPPWFELASAPVYLPPAFFWWWYALRRLCAADLHRGRRDRGLGRLRVDRHRDRHVGVAGARSQDRRRPMARRAGPTRRRFAPPGFSAPTASCSAVGERDYLRHDGPEHVLCFAPTRSGKGVGLVVPTLLTWPGSAIVHDIKGENWKLTAGWRARFGRVLLFDPTNPARAAYNPLLEVRRGDMGGARCPERRGCPGRSRRRARTTQSLGEDQPLAPGRRDPPCPLCRGRQDARRRRQFPVRSEAPDRDDAAGHDDDAASRRDRSTPGRGFARRGSC